MKVKRLFNLGMVIMMFITSFAVSQPVAAEAPAKFTPRIVQGADTVPGEVVVAFADSQDKTLVEKIEQAVDTANTTGGEVTRLSLDGSAVIQVDGDTTDTLAALNADPDVLYAEPNYTYSVPASEGSVTAASDYVFQDVAPSSSTDWKSVMAVPNSSIQSLTTMGVYPADPYVLNNQGWVSIGANIVWPNTTASANICEIDTGVDYTHPDLSYTYSYTYTVRLSRKKTATYTAYATVYRTIPAYDFVNADSDPMDDNGHGTHVAGIMVAQQNNGVGVSGVSTGNVVAVKALDAQGTGTNFDVAKAIQYCADRTDVRVINLSLGGPTQSTALKNALIYATTPTTEVVPWSPSLPGCVTTLNCIYGKGKLVVVAAGNTSASDPVATTPTYPAAYAVDAAFPNNRILSVASTGKSFNGDYNYACKAPSTKMGTWVTVAAPGENIYSTTPYDKPFYMNYYQFTDTRYDYMSGTSMAAAFVSASAARRMGYKPLETNEQVGTLIVNSGDPMNITLANCTPSEMQALKRVNVARLLDRAGLRVSVFDALSGVPLDGGYVAASYLNDGVAALQYSQISADAFKDIFSGDPDPNRIFTYYRSFTDILNIPTVSNLGSPISNYSLLVYKAGYTYGWQPAFNQYNTTTLTAGVMNVFTNGAVPPATGDFNVVLGWQKWNQFTKAAISSDDLDLYVWLPDKTLAADPGQPASFIVGYAGDAFGFMEGDSYGTMTDFPFTRLKREGGFTDSGPLVESTSIAWRSAHGTVPANYALPYYAGSYTVLATDYGQTIDHDGDGCGDNYGYNYSESYTPGAECGAGKTAGIPLLGAYFTPYAYVWKDGVMQYFQTSTNNYGPWAAELTDNASNCNDHWWKAFTISTTTASLAPTYTPFGTANAPVCDNGSTGGFIPYVGANPNTGRLNLSSLSK